MQIQKVQSNQTTFGTKVYLESSTKGILLKSKSYRKFIKQLDTLENNGVNDVFVLTHQKDRFDNTKWLRGVVFEKRENSIFKTPYGSTDALHYEFYGARRNTYANLLKMYKDAKSKWTLKETDNDTFEACVSKMETIK